MRKERRGQYFSAEKCCFIDIIPFTTQSVPDTFYSVKKCGLRDFNKIRVNLFNPLNPC